MVGVVEDPAFKDLVASGNSHWVNFSLYD